MRILLFGDFSGFHLNLKKGLMCLGHDVLLVGSGDSYKQIKCDINLNYNASNIFSALWGRLKPFVYLPLFINYDVVQIVNPYFFKYRFFPAFLYFLLLKIFNKKIFMSACGSDAIYWQLSSRLLEYSPCSDTKKFDMDNKPSRLEGIDQLIYNLSIASHCNSIIPVMYDYYVGYNHLNLCDTIIPLPIHTEDIKSSIPQLSATQKIMVLHGITRYGFKGSLYISEAFKILSRIYPHALILKLLKKYPLGIRRLSKALSYSS